jgi:hypothetical protein
MIDAGVETCYGTGPVDGIGPGFADRCDLGRRGGNSGNADQILPALDLLCDRARIGDLAETVRAELAGRQQNVSVDGSVVMRRLDRTSAAMPYRLMIGARKSISSRLRCGGVSSCGNPSTRSVAIRPLIRASFA